MGTLPCCSTARSTAHRAARAGEEGSGGQRRRAGGEGRGGGQRRAGRGGGQAGGTSAASTLERLVDSLRRDPAAPACVANTAGAEATNPTTGVHPRDDAPAGAEPQATAATSDAGPSAQPPPDVHSPRLALSPADDHAAERPAQALSAAAGPADSEHSATAPPNVPAAAWAQLDAVDLQSEFAIGLPTMQGVPAFLRPGIRQAYTFSLRALRDAHSRAGETQQTRAWKLFLLIPRLLLFRVRVTGSTGREALLQRVRGFLAGRWTALLAAARVAADQLSSALPQQRTPTTMLRACCTRRFRLTALRKPAGGVRGIAMGDTFRRLVSRCLARQ